ncbi:hypothetical protein OsI_33303 [Oryza sativa Indica Group]|uniref:Uncharacterized protein n=1 Tax=Oryza sativa subsp. indica TaxID=39946 RepID=A2Z6M4_ORYSI|nr:hypothetical protein OsI_33303 [Oryza sativa Indica Group]
MAAVTVEITRSEVLRPSPASAGGGEMVPLTVFDRAATDGYIPTMFAWDAAAAAALSNDAIKDGLAAVLSRFPHLAGRFAVDERGRKCFRLNNAGARVLEASAAGDLADALAHDVAAHVNQLYPQADKRMRNLAVHFPPEFVAGLKARVGGARCSTFQCLLAHAWKKITAARDLSPKEYTQVRVAVNCRGRAGPAVPTDYFGNMVLWAFPRMQVRDLLSASYAAVVGVIRDAVARVDERYIQSFVDFGEVAAGDELAPTAAEPGTAFCPDLEVDSWIGFRFHDLDFGGGPPCAFLPPDVPIDGLLIFVPSCAVKGGVEMFMALDDQHVEALRQICYSMD